MSEVATKNITFWNTTDYKYPGFGKTVEVPDGLGGTIAITYNKIDYDDRGWRGKPDGDTPVTEDRFLSGEIENNFSLTGKVKGITATMPQIRTLGKENNYSVTLDFSKYKASAAGSKATDGATSGDTYLAISRFFNGSKTGYTTIKVTAKTVDGSELDLGDWKLFNSGALPNMGRWGGHNARIFLDVANQTISGKNSQGKQEFCPTPPNPGSSFGTDTGLGLFELPSNQRYVSITLSFKQKKIQGGIPNDLHDIYVASNTSSTSSIDATPQTQPTDKPVDINNGLQLHLPLNEIVENAAKQKEVVDISAGKLNGKVNSATVVADDRFGKCINFDGVDDYIELPTTAIPQTGEITISFWANGGKSLPKATTILWAPDQNNHYMVNIHLPWGNVIHFDCGNTTTSDNSGDRISKIAEAVDFKDKWTYWTFTKNVTTGEMSIYLNGSLWHNGTGKNKPINSITQLKFGASDAFYDGKVAHLRIYDRVLSPEEINECMKVDGTPPPMDINRGLQLHLPLNEIVENAAKEKEVVDISAGKLNGKVNGATVVADSRFGNCINFDGVDDYIELPTETIPESNEITISFWANGGKSLPQDNSILWAVNKNNGYVVNIHLPSPGREIYFDCGGNVSYDRIRKSARDVDFKGQWIHWVFTKNVATGEMNIYLNCNLWHSATGKKIALSSVTMVKLGSQRNTRFYDGKVAHLRIYNRVLSLEEINECMKVDGTPPPMDINRGLQLHLPLNEIVENAAKEKEVVDISAGKLNGKVNGATVVADSKFGNCINFDGVDDYIELPTATIPQTGEITISFWANGGKSLPKDNSIILVVEKNNQRVVNIHLPWSDSQIYFDCGNTTTADDSYDRIEKPSQITDFKDKWTYWVVTKNVATGEMKIYLNGSLWQSGVGKQNPLNSITQVKFGCGYGFYDGKVAHLRIYNRVLSPKEINECMKVDETPPPMDINRGLQLHLPLNEIVENAAKEKEVVDVSAAKLKGKVNGNPTVEVDSQLGNCLNFDGVDDYIQMPEMNVDYSQGLTVGAWVHYESFKNWSRIIDFGNDPGSDNILFANQGTTANLTLHNYLGATNHPIQVDGTLEQKKWLYLAATIDESGNGKIYKNGQEVGSGSSSIPNNVNRTQNYVGKSNWSADQLFHGKMSNLRLYNRALSKEEINECMKVDGTPPPEPMDINRGLQLHLPLNEIVENTTKEKEVVDVSTAKLNGKVNGATVVADSKFGNCLSFDGVDDNIQIPEMNVDYSQGFTVEAWVYYDSFKYQSRVIDFANGPGKNNIIFGNHNTTNDGLLVVFVGATRKAIEVKGILEVSKWLHLTATIDESGNAKVYKDGQEVGGGLVAIPNSVNRTKNYVGLSNWSGTGYFHGKMSNLRVYNRVLSPEEINECMEVDATPPPETMDINRGLQLHLPLNEIVENTTKEKEVVDVSTAKLNGKVNGATVVADSKFGNCLSFDGVDDNIQIPEMNVDYSQGFTVEAWCYSSKFKNYSRIIDFANGPTEDNIIFSHYVNNSILLALYLGSKRKELILNQIFENNQWLHLAATVDQLGNAKIYKNGQKVGEGLLAVPNTVNRTKNYLGKTQNAKSPIYFQGKMSNLRLYNRPLSQEEINECIKVDQTPPPVDINRGLQLHLPLNEIVENAQSEKEVVDVSAGKLNGKVYGTPTVEVDNRFRKCINFNGPDDYIELPVATIPETGDITISFWANGRHSGRGNSIILAVDTKNNRVVSIVLPWTDNQVYFDFGGANGYDRIGKLADAVDFQDQWNYWTFTKSMTAGEMKIYVNSSLWESGTDKEKPMSAVTQVRFGSGYDFYDGKVAHLRIYDRVLSPEEIKELMQVDETQTTEKTDSTSTTDAGDGTQTTEKTDSTATTDAGDGTQTTEKTDSTATTNAGDETQTTEKTDSTSTTDAGDGTQTTEKTDSTSTTDAGDETQTTEKTEKPDSTSTTGEGDGTQTTDATDSTATTGAGDGTQTTEKTDFTATTDAGDETQTTEKPDSTSTTGEGDGTQTTDATDSTATTGGDETETSSTDGTDTTQKPMEYHIYQVKRNPTIKTGYSASEWTAVIAGFNCGAKQKHKATALTIMPIVDDGEWKIKCDIKDADDLYWDVAVLFIRNNMVNRLNNFYR